MMALVSMARVGSSIDGSPNRSIMERTVLESSRFLVASLARALFSIRPIPAHRQKRSISRDLSQKADKVPQMSRSITLCGV